MNPAQKNPIRVLVVDDSRVVAEFLTGLLNADPQIEVVGTAADGREAVEAVGRMRPHVITMDIHMPQMNGFEATRSIMETFPTPIVIVSGTASIHGVATNFQALEAGALAVVARPDGIGHVNYDRSVKEMVDMVKLMSEVKVVKRWLRSRQFPAPKTTGILPSPTLSNLPIQVVAIGASTGGPLALRTILSGLPRNLSVPVLIVQHMTHGFTLGFVEWLAESSGFPTKVATAGEPLLPGHAYVAPDDFHLGVSQNRRIVLTREDRENGMRPAVSNLFRSIEAVYGRNAVGVLLTGMGQDGVDELKRLREAGAVTIAQDEETSVVHGMPGQAIKAGAATHILSPESIAKMLGTVVTKV